ASLNVGGRLARFAAGTQVRRVLLDAAVDQEAHHEERTVARPQHHVDALVVGGGQVVRLLLRTGGDRLLSGGARQGAARQARQGQQRQGAEQEQPHVTHNSLLTAHSSP